MKLDLDGIRWLLSSGFRRKIYRYNYKHGRIQRKGISEVSFWNESTGQGESFMTNTFTQNQLKRIVEFTNK